MKKIAISIISLFLFASGLNAEAELKKPYVFLTSSATPAKIEDIRIERRFLSGQKIYYILVAPKKFKYPGVRIRLTKHEEKTSNWGYKILSTKDIYIDESSNTYKDYFILRTKGQYIVEFFYLNNKDYPFARREFLVD